MSTLAQRLQAEINRANVATSKTDTTVHDAIGSLIDGYGNEAVTWHQCPETVRNYLDGVTYDPADYTVSRIAEFAPATAVQSNTKPIGKTVDGVTYYNEVPNQETPFSSANTAGTLKPLDKLRWIQTTDIDNFRDLGGWACDGGTVRYGRLFRGSRLVAETDRDYLLNGLRLGAELDLRYDADIEQAPATLKDCIDYLHADGNWYSLADKSKWKAHISFIFDAIKTNRNVWFHCAGGLDRTGTLACVLEGLLGVSQSDIDKDYELGCFYSGCGTDSTARRRNESEWTGLIGEINAYNGSSFRDKCVNFVASLGFSAEEINAFRAAMIEGNPETVTPAVTSYSITKNLTLTDMDNDGSTIQQGKSFFAKVSSQKNCQLKSLSVSMGGQDITASRVRTVIEGGLDAASFPYHGEIDIPMITGDLVITALSKNNSRLPAEYQEVSWIGGSNDANYTFCIKPDLTWIDFDKIEFTGFRDEYDGYSGSNGIMLLATWTGTVSRTSPYVSFRDSKSGFYCSDVTGYIDNNFTQAQLRESGFKTFTVTFTFHSNIGQVEFGSWSDAGFGSKWQTKEQKWYSGTDLVRHLVPCYRTADGVIGMYDLVTAAFFTNAGGGHLIKGSDV